MTAEIPHKIEPEKESTEDPSANSSSLSNEEYLYQQRLINALGPKKKEIETISDWIKINEPEYYASQQDKTNQPTTQMLEAHEKGSEQIGIDAEIAENKDFIRNHILENDFSYRDSTLPEESKRQMLEWVKKSESASKYAEAIMLLSERSNLIEIRALAANIRDRMLYEAERVGIPISEHGKSVSWAMWDIGKQFYFFINKDERDPNYEYVDPSISVEKQEEILNRHLGFEAYRAYQVENRDWYEKIKDKAPLFLNSLLAKEPKENGTLSSKDLAQLGLILRSI